MDKKFVMPSIEQVLIATRRPRYRFKRHHPYFFPAPWEQFNYTQDPNDAYAGKRKEIQLVTYIVYLPPVMEHGPYGEEEPPEPQSPTIQPIQGCQLESISMLDLNQTTPSTQPEEETPTSTIQPPVILSDAVESNKVPSFFVRSSPRTGVAPSSIVRYLRRVIPRRSSRNRAKHPTCA